LRNILHCITTIELGGAENQLYVLVKEQLKVGMNVSVVYLKGEPELKDKLVLVGAEVLDILHEKNLLRQILILKKFLKGKKMVIHAHLPRAELVSSFARGKNTFIISRHNSEKFFPKAPNFISRLLSLYVSRNVERCITISEAVKSFVLSAKEISSANKITVVHYGYNDEFIFQKDLVIKNQDYVIGTIARLVQQKDHLTLLAAFSQFIKIHPNSKLMLIGSGDLKNDLVSFSKKIGVNEKIIWIDRTENSYTLLYQMDLFVLPSKYEGFGLVLLEAMQVNVPVIAANNSSIPEVLGKNYVGLFESGNIDDLLKKMFVFFENSLSFNLPTYYKENLLKFEPKIMQEKILNVYNCAKSNKI
jgi:glycosyltransferase involved in cell wall biosynthesis